MNALSAFRVPVFADRGAVRGLGAARTRPF
jgi:hypothetical protein